MEIKVNSDFLFNASDDLKYMGDILSDVISEFNTAGYEILNEMTCDSIEELKEAFDALKKMMDEGFVVVKRHGSFLYEACQDYFDTENSVVMDLDTISDSLYSEKAPLRPQNVINPYIPEHIQIIGPDAIPIIIDKLPNADVNVITPDKRPEITVEGLVDYLVPAYKKLIEYHRIIMGLVALLAPPALITGGIFDYTSIFKDRVIGIIMGEDVFGPGTTGGGGSTGGDTSIIQLIGAAFMVNYNEIEPLYYQFILPAIIEHTDVLDYLSGYDTIYEPTRTQEDKDSVPEEVQEEVIPQEEEKVEEKVPEDKEQEAYVTEDTVASPTHEEEEEVYSRTDRDIEDFEFAYQVNRGSTGDDEDDPYISRSSVGLAAAGGVAAYDIKNRKSKEDSSVKAKSTSHTDAKGSDFTERDRYSFNQTSAADVTGDKGVSSYVFKNVDEDAIAETTGDKGSTSVDGALASGKAYRDEEVYSGGSGGVSGGTFASDGLGLYDDGAMEGTYSSNSEESPVYGSTVAQDEAEAVASYNIGATATNAEEANTVKARSIYMRILNSSGKDSESMVKAGKAAAYIGGSVLGGGIMSMGALSGMSGGLAEAGSALGALGCVIGAESFNNLLDFVGNAQLCNLDWLSELSNVLMQ